MISYESSYSILIGHRIRNERIALGMTQSEFAKLLGISPSYLGALERGTRPVSRSIMNRLHEKTEHYRVRRDIGLLLASCSVREAKDCYQLIHTYLDHLRSSDSSKSKDG